MFTLIRNVNVGGTLAFVGGIVGVAYGALSGLSPWAVLLFLVIGNTVAFILAQAWLAWRNLRPLPVAKAPSELGDPGRGIDESPNMHSGTDVARFSSLPETASVTQQSAGQTNVYHFYATAPARMSPYFEISGTVELGGGELFLQLLDHALAELRKQGHTTVARDDIIVRSFTRL